jgi:hypothetical protein
MSTLDKKYYHNIDLDSNELKAGRVYNLTTTQKNALPLNTTHKGYIVYDTDLLSLFTWNGSDWTTAAGSSGTVTSVAALTLGTSGTDLSSTVANGTTTPVITLNVPTASATNRGVLSSADWTIFNGKQSALSGTGLVKSTTGTISYITDNSSNWDTAYTDRNKWDGGATGLVAATGRTSLGLGTFAVVNYPTWSSGTPFVKMTAAGTFSLDTATYLTSAVTSVATAGLISGGTITGTGTITTSINNNKLVGRSSAGTGIMEEITVGTGLNLSAGTLTNNAPDQTIVLTAGTGITTSGTYPNFTITNASPSSGGTVTSVGLSMPSAFSVANSPVTGSGTIAVTGVGTTDQYVRGDGSLGIFPNQGGGGGGTVYYLNGNVSQGSIGGTTMYQLSKAAATGTTANFTKSGTGVIASFITDSSDPNQLLIPSGIWLFQCYLSESGGGSSHAEVSAIVEKWNGTTIGKMPEKNGMRALAFLQPN